MGSISYPSVQWTLAGLFAVLAVVTVMLWVLRRRYPERDWRELTDRTNSWWVLVIVFAVAILVGRVTSLIFLAIMCFLALKEYFSLIPTRRVDRRVLFWAYLAIPVQFYWIGTGWYVMFLIWVPVYMFLLMPMIMVIAGETKGFLRAAGSIQWGLMICVFLLSHTAELLAAPDDGNPVAGSAGWLLYLVILTQLNDVAQYLWGKAIGKTKAAPSVSPNKTVEGFLGGLGSTLVLAALLAPVLTPFDQLTALLAGAIIAFAGFFGDLVISALKRDLGVKDAGSLLPGHGGVLDRLDSLAFAAPLFFHFVAFLYY
ncbi:MAG: phosphatidate cytidylyltransferase [Pseudomonadota bacterium]